MVELKSVNPAHFCWATGIENTFIPQVRPGYRRMDEYELTQHYQLWREDFDLLAETGVQAVRWGIPWYRVQPKPNQWDWRWPDQALDYLVNVKGITPILDLMHYGTPLWLDNSFINARYPDLVAEYARAVAARYKSLVRYYTPLNEPLVNADWCGRRAEWPPYLTGDDGFVKLVLALARGIVQTVQVLKAEQPEMITVQVEALWRFFTDDQDLQPLVSLNNARQYLSLDLTTGHLTDDHPLCNYLREHGTRRGDLAWFQENSIRFDVLGLNFYPWSYGKVILRKDGRFGRLTRNVSGLVIGNLLSEASARYQVPLMISETSSQGNYARRGRWMDDTIAAVHALRRQGVPITGYTWFPFFSMFNWFYRTGRRPLANYQIDLGLYDAAFDAQGVFRRSRTSLVDRFQKHMASPVPLVGSGGG